MNNSTRKNKVNGMATQEQTLMLANAKELNGFSVRLAGGESWDTRSAQLATLVVQEAYLHKLHIPQPADNVGLRMNQVTIRHNHFEPEFEPTRHEMRIFDALDGMVTEM